MPSKDSPRTDISEVELDLYFLIARFLNNGPCRETGLALIRELTQNGLLHRTLDWTGCQRQPDFSHSISRFRDLHPDYLLRFCERIGSLLDSSFPPPIRSSSSLCGLGRYSVLRNEKSISTTRWNTRAFSACIGANPLVPPNNFSKCHNWAYSIFGRENGGSRYKNLLRPIETLYRKISLHQRILGHLSSVYCVLFDRTGMRIYTGSDDCLIKLWSSSQGRLLATFRGHQSEICDMDISYENTILASASCDKEIRIWDARNGKPITILQSHTAIITSVEFSPLVLGHTRYLITTGRDGNVIFWIWNVQSLDFESQPHKFEERNRPGVAMLCSSCSAGGHFVTVGGSDNLVHIYHIPVEYDGTSTIGPLTIAEQDEHTNTVDSIKFSHGGLRLISGSKDGTARIWTFEYSMWTSLVLDVSRTFDSPLDPVLPPPNPTSTSSSKPMTSSKSQGKDAANKVRVIMVAWDCCDENVMTSLTDFTVKVWNSNSRRLVCILKGHTDEAYCLEPHPSDKRVLLSAGHDGNVFLWDVVSGSVLMNFHNMLEGLGHGAVFDAKFSRDGNSFACTDSHGHLLIFGYGDGKAYQKCPVQQFFHTDYRPLIRDQQGYVLDEQTQQAPHLMPPPFLVDMDGNPYPSEQQRLVPGREGSNESQLSNIVIQEDNIAEVIDVENIPDDINPIRRLAPQSALDERIQEMLHGADSDEDPNEEPPPFASPSSSVRLRREGDTAGVRQMHSNAPRSQVASVADIVALNQRVITPQFSIKERELALSMRRNKAQSELQWYKKERKRRRPLPCRRLSRDIPKEHDVRRSKVRHSAQPRFKEDPIIEEEDSGVDRERMLRSRRLKLFASSHPHRYSTRSTAPRRRLSSGYGDNEPSKDTGDELSSSDVNEASPDSSSEEDFTVKVRVSRRSRRNDSRSQCKENGRKRPHSILGNVLRRSQRQRKVPNRLKNFDSGDSSAEDKKQCNANDVSAPVTSSRSTKENGGAQIERNGRKERKQRLSRNAASNVDSSSTNCKNAKVISLPSTSKTEQNEVHLNGNAKICKPVVSIEKFKVEVNFDSQGEPVLLECYLPPEWILRVSPCSFPYVPQIDDEVVYIRQSHEMYVTKVSECHVWSIRDTDLCYLRYPDIGFAEPCQVTNIEYRVGPPTLCEVQLRRINRKMSNKSFFTVCYHDMPNVVDFLILKDKYDVSISRRWQEGDAFRSIIDDTWWHGTVIKKEPADSKYPESHFQAIYVLWDSDNGQADYDYLSPWDMEPIPHGMVTRSQNSAKSHTRVDSEDLIDAVSYKLKISDWSRDNSDSDDDSTHESMKMRMVMERSRIARGIEQLILDGQFDEFVNPVDVMEYTNYPLYVAFPTDLSTILQRVKNQYYRRYSAISWEARQLEKNAIAYNEPESIIAKKAKVLYKVIDGLVRDSKCSDVHVLLSQIQDLEDETNGSSFCGDDPAEAVKAISDGNVESASDAGEEENQASESESLENSEYLMSTEEEITDIVPTWVEECKSLLAEVMQAHDSRPFRQRIQKEDDDIYADASDSENAREIDLTTIEGKLLNLQYTGPEQLENDVQEMFASFKNSNPSREGRSMLARLSPLMKSRIAKIVSAWKKTQATISSAATRRSSRPRRSMYRTRNVMKQTESNLRDPAEGSLAPTQSNMNDVADASDNESDEVYVDGMHEEYEITKSRAAKRQRPDSDKGQGDASLSLYLRKKSKRVSDDDTFVNEDPSASSSDDSGRSNIVKTRAYSKPSETSRVRLRSRRSRERTQPRRYQEDSDLTGSDISSNHTLVQTGEVVRKSARTRKPARIYVDRDSDSDFEEHVSVMHTEDPDHENQCSSANKFVAPKKNARFRNGSFLNDTEHDRLPTVKKNRSKRRISSYSNYSDSDDR